MKCDIASVWTAENIPEYHCLFSSDDLGTRDTAVYYGINAESCAQAEHGAALGLAAARIFFSAPGKTAEDLLRTIGKCRFVANDREELCRINQAAQPRVKPGTLEYIGLRVISEAYDGGAQIGIAERDLPALAQTVKTLPAISIGGCFVQGNIGGLHGKALGKYFRTCYELAKRVTVILPCGMPYLCIVGGAAAALKNAQEHPETLEDFLREARIVAAQNETAFYARLLLT